MLIYDKTGNIKKFTTCDENFLRFARDFILVQGRSFTNLAGFVSGGSTRLTKWKKIYGEVAQLHAFYMENLINRKKSKMPRKKKDSSLSQ